MYRVTKKNNISKVSKIDNYIDKIEILDTLGVKASDIFQSNGIIWVEGPSDRIYIKRWLEVFCGCKYEEGKHYQFMYYGGRMLSHYTTEEEKDLINILTTNRNAAIVMDSDKRNQQAQVNETKKRIVSEFEKFNMFSWITMGREIENYLPVDAINGLFDCESNNQCGKYESFSEYIKDKSKNFNFQKVKFSQDIRDFITLENSRSILDLEKQIKLLYSEIQSWNT